MSFLESKWKSAAGYSPRHVEFQTAQAVQRDRARADVRLRDSGDIGAWQRRLWLHNKIVGVLPYRDYRQSRHRDSFAAGPLWDFDGGMDRVST